jgi:hypothetical protein
VTKSRVNPVGVDPIKEIRRDAAKKRQDERNSRTNTEQIALLKTRPGFSGKEISRLEKIND